MKIEKRTEATRRYRIEYPLFSEAGDVSFMNSFSEKLACALTEKSEAEPDLKISLTYAVSEYDGKVDVTFRFASRRRSERRAGNLRIIWKEGYIIKFERS